MARQRTNSDVSRRVREKIKRASEFPHNQHFCFYGEPGSGKTRLAASAPNCLIIDVDEKGTDSVRNDFDPYVVRIERWQELNDIYWFLQEGEHEFESVAVDTITALNTICLNFVLGDEAARDASRDPDMPSRQVYGKVGKLMRTQITNFRNLPINTIFLAQVRAKESGEDEEMESVTTYGPDVSPSIAKHLDAAVGTIAYLVKKEVFIKSKASKTRRREVRRRLLIGDSPTYISKDRNYAFGEFIDAPNLTDMLALIYKEA
jgi:hypothetical protein